MRVEVWKLRFYMLLNVVSLVCARLNFPVMHTNVIKTNEVNPYRILFKGVLNPNFRPFSFELKK